MHDGEEITVGVQHPAEQPGTRIGPYKLLQVIRGRWHGCSLYGGADRTSQTPCGIEDHQARMDSRQVIARFEAERQALAMMVHPNIAKVLDAESTNRRTAFLRNELVNGIPVTKYCDEQHLTPRERLELFVPICRAVQHAHQKGVIHRDLKPSNVLAALYDGKPIPKVIDFGVAKATSQKLTDRTLFTQFGQIFGTLEYMSPEQAQRNQLDVDTRSDYLFVGCIVVRSPNAPDGSTPPTGIRGHVSRDLGARNRDHHEHAFRRHCQRRKKVCRNSAQRASGDSRHAFTTS